MSVLVIVGIVVVAVALGVFTFKKSEASNAKAAAPVATPVAPVTEKEPTNPSPTSGGKYL